MDARADKVLIRMKKKKPHKTGTVGHKEFETNIEQ